MLMPRVSSTALTFLAIEKIFFSDILRMSFALGIFLYLEEYAASLFTIPPSWSAATKGLMRMTLLIVWSVLAKSSALLTCFKEIRQPPNSCSIVYLGSNGMKTIIICAAFCRMESDSQSGKISYGIAYGVVIVELLPWLSIDISEESFATNT